MPKTDILGRVRCFLAAMTLLLSIAPVAVSGSPQHSDNGQQYSGSLLVAPFSKSPEYLRYPDGRQQLLYVNENAYPAEDVLSFLRRELKKRGWKPLTQDFFNPEKPSSERNGWEFVEDQTQKTSKATWQWSSEWVNGSQDITMYFLKYESPTNSPLDSKILQITALYIPAEIAGKMKRDAKKVKPDWDPKL